MPVQHRCHFWSSFESCLVESVDTEPTDTKDQLYLTWANNKSVLESGITVVTCYKPFSPPFLPLHLNQKHHRKRHNPARCALLGISIRTVVHPSTVLKRLLQANLTGGHVKHLEKTRVNMGSGEGGEERIQETSTSKEESQFHSVPPGLSQLQVPNTPRPPLHPFQISERSWFLQ